MESPPAKPSLTTGRSRGFFPWPAEVRIALLYLLAAGLWIWLSDRLVQWMAGDLLRSTRLQTIKGIFFVTATAAFLYWLLRRNFRKRERAIKLARDACERFELVARASNDAIWDWDLKTNELWWSEGFHALFGFSKQELEPTLDSWTNRLHPEDQARAVASLHRAAEAGSYWEDEYRFRRKNGTYAHVFDRGFVVLDAQGQPARMVGGMMDVTARKRAEEQLEKSRRQLRALSVRLESLREEERTRISREIHDELGQMLTGLKMDLRWTEKKIADFAGNTPALNPILDKLVGASELADQTIDRVQKIAGELRPGVLDNFGLASALKYEAQRFQDRTGIVCNLRLPEVMADLKADLATAIFRIFQETLTNITRHAQATRVDVELRLENEKIVLRVEDNGVGIRSEDLANPKSIGLLGMKERAALLHGEIAFARGPSGGTVVRLQVPQAANDTKFWELV